VSPEKNILKLVEAADVLPQKLAIYGPVSPPNLHFEAAFRRKLVGSNAEWKGPLPGNQVRTTLSQYEVFVNPSLTEGLPFTVLEAAAEGLHLVLSDIRPHRLLGFPSCDYVDPETLDLAPLLRDVNGNREANRVHARREYDIETMLCSYRTLYQEVAGVPARS
jgi:glycosyltransferase involved in cell wall biosynthesis